MYQRNMYGSMIDVPMIICWPLIMITFYHFLWLFTVLHIHTYFVIKVRWWGCWWWYYDQYVHDDVDDIKKRKRWGTYHIHMYLFICLEHLDIFIYYYWFLERTSLLVMLMEIGSKVRIQGYLCPCLMLN